MLKRAEIEECRSEMGRKETLREAASQAVMVIERIALDANLVFYDIVMEVKEIIARDARRMEEFIERFRASSILSRHPRVAAMVYSAIILK